MRWAKSLDSLSLGESLVLLVLLAMICPTEQKLLVTASVSVKMLLVAVTSTERVLEDVLGASGSRLNTLCLCGVDDL